MATVVDMQMSVTSRCAGTGDSFENEVELTLTALMTQEETVILKNQLHDLFYNQFNKDKNTASGCTTKTKGVKVIMAQTHSHRF